MKEIFRSQKYFFLLISLFILSLLIVKPTGEFPLNDDWSYTKSVLKLQNEGRIDIGTWPAMTLASHLVWGFLFVKVFGFSFFILRVSTWISVIIGMWVLNNLLFKIVNNRLIALVGASTLLFNPIYYNLSSTFMTDVNFITLTILCFHFAYDFFKTGSVVSFILVYVLSLILVLLRQYGIIMPACMTFTTLFVTQKRIFFILLGGLFSIVIYTLFEMYEDYLKSFLPGYSAYKYSGYINPFKERFYTLLQTGLITRYKTIIVQNTFYVFPLMLAFLPAVFRKANKWIFFLLTLGLIYVIYLFYGFNNMQQGNIFTDTSLGPDTSYETLTGTYHEVPHFYSKKFDIFLKVLTYLFVALTTICVVFFIREHITRNKKFWRLNLFSFFLLCVGLSYILMILITESYFDRYQLPLITIGIIFTVHLQKLYQARPVWSMVPLLFFFYLSVAGTHDYFAWNREKWKSYNFLTEEKKIPHLKINAGFEAVCWKGREPMWYDFNTISRYDYLVQFQTEDSFAVMKEYPFRRYLPFRQDTIRVFKRFLYAEGKKPSDHDEVR